MNVFSYKVKCIRYETDEKYTSTGLGLAESFSHAMKQLEIQYGPELTEVLSLYLMEESEIIALPEAAVEEYKKAEFPDIAFEVPLN